MRIGIDFDNTIVCYERLFYDIARERGIISEGVPPTKNGVRDHLRRLGREAEWTELQGYVYGARMKDAPPFVGVKDFLSASVSKEVQIYIISHRTRFPCAGKQYDLHKSAQEWLEYNGFYDRPRTGLSANQVHFELTKQEKLARIAEVGCAYFIDDLPEFLEEPLFPAASVRVLFDPNQTHTSVQNFRRYASWPEINHALLR